MLRLFISAWLFVVAALSSVGCTVGEVHPFSQDAGASPADAEPASADAGTEPADAEPGPADAEPAPGDAAAAGEACDGLDNDGDEVVDEGCACEPDATQRCYVGPVQPPTGCEWGAQTCAGGGWGECAGASYPPVGDTECSSVIPAILDTAETVRIYRLYRPASGDYMSSTDGSEGASQGYSIQRSFLFYTFDYGYGTGTPASARPIYRCLVDGWDHMESTASNCEGTVSEGVLGYLLDSPRSGHAAFYRCVHSDGQHFSSFDADCEGHVTEGILGYARVDGHQWHNHAVLSSGSGECVGRCGAGCEWMPWEAWTPECLDHDECVEDNGHLLCVGSFFDAAVSYVEAGFKSLAKAVVDAVTSVFDWF